MKENSVMTHLYFIVSSLTLIVKIQSISQFSTVEWVVSCVDETNLLDEDYPDEEYKSHLLFDFLEDFSRNWK